MHNSRVGVFFFILLFWWGRLTFKSERKRIGIGAIGERCMREGMCMAFLHGLALRLYVALFVWGFRDFGIFLLLTLLFLDPFLWIYYPGVNSIH